MSNTTKRPFGIVKLIADSLLETISPMFTRIEIAGSLRRQKRDIGDIEFVAIPIPKQTALDGTISPPYMIDGWLAEQVQQEKLTIVKNGPHYKQFRFTTTLNQVYIADLFLQPDPQTWGVNFMIRTGNDDFVRWMVTDQNRGGAKPADLRIREARVWRGIEPLATPEEEDVFTLFDLDWIPPEERNGGRWR